MKDHMATDFSHTVFLVVDDIEAMRKVISYQLRTLGAPTS